MNGSAASGWNVVFASSTLGPAESVTGAAELTPVDAYVQAADAVGADVSVVNVDVAGSTQGWTKLDVAGLTEANQLVRHVAFPTPKRGVRNAYDTFFTANGANEGYHQVVDAETGEILLRESTVHNLADNPLWKAFPANPQMTPISRYPWNFPSVDSRDLWCMQDVPGCKTVVANAASPAGWDTNAATNTPTFTTTGNNNDNFEAWLGNAGNNFRPVSPTRDYLYPFTNVWYTTKSTRRTSWSARATTSSAAVTNLFAMHNRLHDFAYNLGFTEMTWNAQTYNFGKPFLQNDALRGRAQSGAVTARATTRTWGPGPTNISTTNMFLWQPQAPRSTRPVWTATTTWPSSATSSAT